MASSSSKRHHHLDDLLADQGLPPAQQQLPAKGKGTVEEETRDWAEVPLDALLAVLRRLDVVDILMGASHVCRPWRRVTQEEPELWRHIDIRHLAKLVAKANNVDLQPAARAAVKNSSGRCEAFWAQRLAVDSDNFFLFLADAAPQLKSLRLISCTSISKHGLNQGISKFHMLEELELSLHSDAAARFRSSFFSLAETCNAAAEACPLLKRLRLNKYCFHWRSGIRDSEAMEIGKMRGIRFLQLFGNSLTNVGLRTILHGCVRLESLDIRHCFNVDMDVGLRAACARLNTLRLPDDSFLDYDLRFGNPEMYPGWAHRNVGDSDEEDRAANMCSDWHYYRSAF